MKLAYLTTAAKRDLLWEMLLNTGPELDDGEDSQSPINLVQLEECITVMVKAGRGWEQCAVVDKDNDEDKLLFAVTTLCQGFGFEYKLV